jgi:hypothetical protein
VPREVFGRSAGHHQRLAEPARDYRIGADAADPDGDVYALFDEIDDPVRKRDVEREIGIALEKPGDRRCGMAHAEIHRGAHLEGAARQARRARRFVLGFLQILQQLDAALVEGAPRLGQRDPSRRPVQEPILEMRFKLGDVP